MSIFLEPCLLKNGMYMPPKQPGFSIQMKKRSIENWQFKKGYIKLMDLELKNKTALITASAQGIGKTIAQTFANEGANVIATDINENLLLKLSKTNGITPIKLDVTDTKTIQHFTKSLNK